MAENKKYIVKESNHHGWLNPFFVHDGEEIIEVQTVDIYTYVCTKCPNTEEEDCEHTIAVMDHVENELDKLCKKNDKF